MSVRDALEKYSRRHSGITKKRAKNSRPEKDVEKEILAWSKEKGLDLSVVESKAVYSRAAGTYLRGQAEAGFSDLVGTTADGLAVFVELKAKGKRKTLRPHQWQFLMEKIRKNAFACCTDSRTHIDSLFSLWSRHRQMGSIDMARQILEQDLPPAKVTGDTFDL